MNLTTWLLAIVGPAALRVLTALGLSIVTFTGVTEVVRTMVTAAQTSWAGLPAAVLGLASLAGVPEALGMITGAMVARTALWAATSATKLIFK